MKKIGIVTIIDYTNFGNRLQNYAVYKILCTKLNCRAVTLIKKEQKPFCDGNYILWMKEQVARLLCTFPNFAERRFGNNITRWSNFKKWSRRIPSRTFYGCKALPKIIANQYDYFIAGSDQIWNYHFSSLYFNDFFLKFSEDQKKIALSASFGIDHIPDNWKLEYRDNLKKFSSISVREDAGNKIIKELLHIDVPVLIDPTMMLGKEEWMKTAKRPRVDCSKKYVLKYYLGEEKEENIDKWARENGYEVYELMNEETPELYSAGPGEFISLIEGATLVCSDSFHCIVFSIIFSKPFIVYERKGKEADMTSRLDTLLEKFGLQGRWKDRLMEDDYLKCDFSSVSEILNKEQKTFLQYVENAIGGR